jgi:Ca2+-binding RTX toxin-like protein
MPKIVEGTNGNDYIDYGTNGDDLIYGYGGHDTIFGFDGEDTLFGMQGNDNLFGGNGSDTLRGGGGFDYIHGGVGYWDTAAYGDSPAGVTVSLIFDIAAGGDATGDELDEIENLLGSGHADTLAGDNGDNRLDGQDGHDELKGYGGNDRLYGQDGHDSLDGGADHDVLYGGIGNDVLNGGPGPDDMYGGIGNDIYIVDCDAVPWISYGDDIFEYAGEGNDTVRTSVSYSLSWVASIEILETTNALSTGAIHLVGNATNNHIIGNDGDNYINGLGGSDHMTGNGGNDIYIVDNAGNWVVSGDWITEAGGEGMDEVRTSVSWTLTAGADVEILVADHSWYPLQLTGNETGNTVLGNNGDNVLNGGAGDDELTGLGGQDSFRFDTQLDADTNVDAITDFSIVDDTILLDDDIFTSGLVAGSSVAGGQFVIGAAALDANDRIIYNSATGALFYDSDGVGGTSAIQFATLSAGLALTHLDFLVVA